MEALAALGVAAASVQFLDFALQALTLCRQIRDDAQGATAPNKELESYSRSIEGLSQELKAGQTDNASGRPIKAVGQACIAKTEEILIVLEKVRKAGSNSRTAAAKTLFRSLKERRTIEKLQNELKEKQTLLDSALIHDIQRRVDLSTVKQDENFTSLKQSVQDLVNKLQDQDAVAQQNHAESQDKLTNLAKGNQELRATTVAGHSKTVQRLDQIHVGMGQGFDNLKISDAKEQLLRSLFYPEHAARREMVKPPWSDTFDWVFDETSKSTAYWSSLPAWLKSGSSLYWITGKPASGKSTLMAHILHDERTAYYLQQWSGGGTLRILSFFFWRPGSALQKSISGLLRSLVMQLADEVPEVAPAILGGLNLQPGRMPTWSERGLTDALRLALTAAKDVYLLFLLDGLDEFDGPYGELVDLIFEMKDSKNVKFCVSSRREAGLANRLCQYDHLSMEDLNVDAIRTYAQDKLSPVTDGRALSKEIAHRSQGVFLWAVLTTQSLLHGAFDCSEDVDMLHRRLESTPDEMIQLFGQILATVDKVHKEQLYIWMRLLSLKVNPTVLELAVMRMPDCATTYDALSTACQLTRKHIDYFSRGLLCVDVLTAWPPWEEIDQLWHAPEMTRGSKGISPEDLKRRKTQTTAGRSLGEVDQAMRTVVDVSGSSVRFLHRSVLDFAANDSVTSMLGLGDMPGDWDIILGYVQARLKVIAVCPRRAGVNWIYVKLSIRTLSRNADILGANIRPLLDELLTLACAFHGREIPSEKWPDLDDVFSQLTPALQCLVTAEQSFFCECLRIGFSGYVLGSIHRFFDRDDEGYCMARIALCSTHNASDSNNLQLLALLLERLRNQLDSKRVARNSLEPKRLFREAFGFSSRDDWYMLRIPEAKENGLLLSAMARELCKCYDYIIKGLPRRDILLPFILPLIQILDISGVGIGKELLSSCYNGLVLFVSPCTLLLRFSELADETTRLLMKRAPLCNIRCTSAGKIL
ncbi:hypothetical protein D0866_00905 [Hortaea werneckii]|uniref:Nephrocystin 3-like N-terminal domain-containing protein n=1 Tax=Hortaea werneckii TaxID=91943 RepID=A0A3M7BMG6_HORWE|nr:hypothetical protein D0866_00905 [Hortaea werneckii]